MPFDGKTSADLAVSASSIVDSGLDLLTILAPIVLIGLAVAFAPKLIGLVRKAVGK